jgi:lipopolysaccharide biosynthesis glycosyltransferase
MVKNINICICADNDVIRYAAPLMLSIVENTSEAIVFHILCNKEN